MRSVVTQQVSTDGEMTLIGGAPSDCDCKVVTPLLLLVKDLVLACFSFVLLLILPRALK